MKLNTAAGTFTTAFIISLGGFILSVAKPQNKVSDGSMTVALFVAAACGIIASVLKKTGKKQTMELFCCRYIVILNWLFYKDSRPPFCRPNIEGNGWGYCHYCIRVLFVLNRGDFKNSKWIFFIPFILLGCRFRHLYWTGGNSIIFANLLIIIILSAIQLAKPKTKHEDSDTSFSLADCHMCLHCHFLFRPYSLYRRSLIFYFARKNEKENSKFN